MSAVAIARPLLPAVPALRRLVIFLCAIAPLYYAPFISPHIVHQHGALAPLFRSGKDVVALGLIALWLATVLVRGRIRIPKQPMTIYVALWILVGVVVAIMSGGSSAFKAVRLFIEFSAFAFIFADLLCEERHVISLLRGLVGVSALVSVIGFIEYALGGLAAITHATGHVRIISTMYNPNALGWFLAFSNAIIIGLWEARRRVRFGGCVFALNLAALFLSGSRTSLVALAVVVISAGLYHISQGRISRKWLAASGLLICAAFIYVAASPLIGSSTRTLHISAEAGNVIHRVRDSQVRIVEAASSARTLLIGTPYTPTNALDVDSEYVNVYYRGGLVAALLLLVIVLRAALSGLRTIRSGQTYAWPVLLGFGVLVVVCASGSSLQTFPHALYFWGFAGLLATRANTGTPMP